MKKVDTENILKKTNQLIGYENYKREEKIMKKKLRNMTFVLVAVVTLVGGTFTANAMTDNSIVEGIKNAFKVQVNGEEKNAKCEKVKDGYLKCVLDNEVLGNDNSEVTIELDENYADDVSLSFSTDGENTTSEIEIKDKNN